MPVDATFLLRLYANARLTMLSGEDPVRSQSSQLMRMVRRARATRFGRDHGFGAIRSVADYQRAVPLRRHGDLWRDYWSGPFPVLDDVTWPGRIPYFAFTSGTASGASKLVPVSRAMVRANHRAALDTLVHHLANRPASRVFGGKNFILGGSTDLVDLAPGIRRGDLSGIAAAEVPAWARPWSFPPPEEALDPDWERKIDRLARLSMQEDIRSLSGTPSWVLLFLDRLAALGGRLYPRLELYVHGGVSFAPYAERFARLLAGSRAETREVYPASEGFVAVADRAYGQGLHMLTDNGLFFEFIPLDQVDRPHPQRAWMGDVRPGVDYALALTTCAGLWSTLLGDVVRLVETRPPRLLVVGRTGAMLNLFGEHLSGEQIEDAVAAAARATGLAVTDYAMGGQFAEGSHRGRHVMVVEFAAPPAGSGAFQSALDAALRRGSLDYDERRAAGVGLEPPRVMAVPPGFFAAWMRARGRLGGQNKVPRVITDPVLLDSLLRFPSAPARAP